MLTDGLKIYELESLLGFMRQHGSSVLLNWGEDNDQWECSWIMGGGRFTAHAGTSYEAARRAVRKATSRQATLPAPVLLPWEQYRARWLARGYNIHAYHGFKDGPLPGCNVMYGDVQCSGSVDQHCQCGTGDHLAPHRPERAHQEHGQGERQRRQEAAPRHQRLVTAEGHQWPLIASPG